MADPQIVKNIRSELQTHESKEDIVRILRIQGYGQAEIDEAFAEFEKQSDTPPDVKKESTLPSIETASSPAVQETIPSQVAQTQPSSVTTESVSTAPTAQPTDPTPVSPANPIPTQASSQSVPAPTSVSAAPASNKMLVTGLLVALFGVSAAAGFAFYKGIGPFAVNQYTEDTFISSVLSKATEIKTGSYAASVSIRVNEREEDAFPFEVPADDPLFEQDYDSDRKQLVAIAALRQSVKSSYGDKLSYDFETKKYTTTPGKGYPAKLTAKDESAVDMYISSNADSVPEYSYTQTEEGKNFMITTSFKTDAAISKIRKSSGYSATNTPIDGLKVTFTKDSGYFSLSSKPPQPFFLTLTNLLKQLSPDVVLSVAVGATTDFTNKENSDWKGIIQAMGDFSDLTYEVDIEGLKKGEDYYFRINKMPSVIPYISGFKGQWVKVSPKASSTQSSISSLVSVVDFKEIEDTYQKNREQTSAALRNIALLADKHTLISFKRNPTKERVDGRSLIKYEIEVNKDALLPFYKDIFAEAEKYKDLELMADEGLLRYLESEEFEKTFAYFKGNTFLTVWADDEGFPVIVEYRMRIVPPETATQLAGKQVDVVIKNILSDVNDPVTITPPAEAKTIEEITEQIERNSGNN